MPGNVNIEGLRFHLRDCIFPYDTHTHIYIYILQFIICDFTMVFPYSSSICSWLLRVFVSHASEVKVFPRSSLSGI